MAYDVAILRTIGIVLIAPIIGGMVIGFVVIPILIFADRKHHRETNKSVEMQKNDGSNAQS